MVISDGKFDLVVTEINIEISWYFSKYPGKTKYNY